MKNWTKRIMILFAAMAVCMLLGSLVSAAEKESMPLDGKEREFTKMGTDEEPDQAGGTYLATSYRYYDRANDAEVYRIFCTGYGLLTVSGRNSYNNSISIRLLDRNYNVVNAKSSWYSVNSTTNTYAYYGVQRGPYYIEAHATTSTYYLSALQELKANRAGSSQYYSLGMNQNVTYTGIMPCNEDWRNVDWYTFYLPYNSQFKVFFTAKGDGYVDLKLYGPGISTSGFTYASWFMNKTDNSTMYRTSGGYRYPCYAGRYYFKLERSSSSYKRTSCAYWLRWKVA